MARVLLTCLLIGAQALLHASPQPGAAAVNRLGLDLLRLQRGNVVLSPWSVDQALAMVWEGARGETRNEMARVLDFHGAETAPFASLDKGFAEVAKNVRLDTANRIFGQSGFAFRPAYLELLTKNYGAPLESVDFVSDPESAATTINSWVAERTHDRIRDLVSADSLTPDTRLVLVNAIYFKAGWQSTFEAAATQTLPFRVTKDKSVGVRTMTKCAPLGYRKAQGYTAVNLPYVDDLVFLILLPDDPSGLPALERGLDAKTLTDLANLEVRPVLIYLPRFKLEPPTIDLNIPLQALGMKSAFDRKSADFDGIAPVRGRERLFISHVIHRAFISVDEQGTEAAAATAVMMAFGAAPDVSKPIEVRVNRPFLFAVQHSASGACLFLGRVNDPR
jgi:serpin B